MSITKVPLQNLVARLVISPAPITLGESTAVLKKLQSFGHVISFATTSTLGIRQVHPRSGPQQLDVQVVFLSRDTLETAQSASPFTVKVNYGLPDPVVEDPYNVRGLQSRKQPSPKTMVCHLEAQEAEPPSGQTVLSKGFSPSMLTRLSQSLMDLRPASNIAGGLGVFHVDSPNLKPTAHLVDQAPNLMEMYRSQPVEEAEASKSTRSRSSLCKISTTDQ
jgi:hypothetical protein